MKLGLISVCIIPIHTSSFSSNIFLIDAPISDNNHLSASFFFTHVEFLPNVLLFHDRMFYWIHFKSIPAEALSLRKHEISLVSAV